ncbi:MAG: hypothetical protein K2X87_23430 [Gemmataceae bacterium]|nr:hypothetical protein [Gemmataceae bacterium]
MPPTPEPTSRPGLWPAWAAFAGLALAGFCFGVWAGTQRPERVAVAQPPSQDKSEPKGEAKPDPKPQPKQDPPEKQPKAAPPKAAPPADPEPDEPAPKPETPPPAKPPEPKPADPKPPEKKPDEPKKAEPKKPEPKKGSAPAVTFAKDVQPVVRSHCLNCHGGVGAPKGGLDLRNRAAALKGGDSGPGVKPGEPDASPVWQQIDGEMMPPEGKPRLSEKEKKVIRDWIEGGAK